MNPLSPEHERIAAIIVDSALKVHRELGPGLLEKFYEACLCYELELAGLQVSRQVCVRLKYKDTFLEEVLRLDILVEGKIVIEVKAVELMTKLFQAQLISQLKITGHQLGFLINFDVPLIKDGIKRIILS